MRHSCALVLLFIGSLAINANQRVNAQDSVNKPKVLVAVAPDYPESAKPIRAEGRVVVEVKVNEKGLVRSATIKWGPETFSRVSLEAARQWKFAGGKQTANLAFVFRITDKREEQRVSFVPPDQVEIVVLAPGRVLALARPRVAENEATPEVIRSVAPTYPPIAMMARASGIVEVQMRIDDRGRVLAATVKGGHPLLQASAVSAAKQWEFSLSTSREERLVTVRFSFQTGGKDKSGGTSFKSPYEVEVVATPQIINTTNYEAGVHGRSRN